LSTNNNNNRYVSSDSSDPVGVPLDYDLVGREVGEWGTVMEVLRGVIEREQGWEVGNWGTGRKEGGVGKKRKREEDDMDDSDSDGEQQSSVMTVKKPLLLPSRTTKTIHRFHPLIFPREKQTITTIPKWSKFCLHLSRLEQTLKKTRWSKTSEKNRADIRREFVNELLTPVIESLNDNKVEGIRKRKDLVERVWRVGVQVSGGNMSGIKILKAGEKSSGDRQYRLKLELGLAELSLKIGYTEKNTVVT